MGRATATPVAAHVRVPATGNCITNSSTGAAPSGVHGAVGPDNIIVVTNIEIGVYRKDDCSVVAHASLNALFGANQNAGEAYFTPQVLWDDANRRFVVTAESTFASSASQEQGLAISKDSSGASWWVYVLSIIDDGAPFCVPNASNIWDYPRVGSLNGASPRWFITANVISSSGTGTGAIIAFTKRPSLFGAPTVALCFPNVMFNTAPPNVEDSSEVAYFLSPGSGGGDSIARYRYMSIGDTITSTDPIAIESWLAPPNAPQPNGITLDVLDGRFVSQTIQSGNALWNVHPVASSGLATGRLYKLSTTDTSPLFTKDLFTSPTDSIFNLSVATNDTKAFVSASRTIPSDATHGNAAMVVFSGPHSAAGGWRFDLVATSTAQYNGCSDEDEPCPWGSTSAQIDPSNTASAWAFNQLISGPSEANWVTRAASEAANFSEGAATHDFNGDGKSDLALRDTSGNTAVWLMSGAQVLSSGSIGAAPTTWSIVGQRDFNGDGNSDLLWRDEGGNTAMWFLNGTQVASSAAVGNIPNTWTIAGTGDFDGDGIGDLLWRDSGGNLAVWIMNATSVLSSAGLGNVPAAWIVVGTGDFDGDGRSDLLWRDNLGNTSIWFMNGVQVSTAAGVGNVPNNWTVVGTGDFNGDGKSDIAWRDDTGNTAIWLMNGATVTTNGNLGNVSVSWSMVQTGDYNGDGMSDLLWRDGAGNTAMWFLNGVSVSSSLGVGSIPNNWTIQSTNSD